MATLKVNPEERMTVADPIKVYDARWEVQEVGIKFTVPTVHAIDLDCGPLGRLAKVREIYHSSERFPDTAGGSLTVLNLTREYIGFSLNAARVKEGDLQGLTVVLDAFHGSAGPEIYQALTAGALRPCQRCAPFPMLPHAVTRTLARSVPEVQSQAGVRQLGALALDDL